MKFYAGIGSRETPDNVLAMMTDLAVKLGCEGWTLRSGCAPGADTAFEHGAFIAVELDNAPTPELYLPWRKFERQGSTPIKLHEPTQAALACAAQHHPNWTNLSQGAQKLHGRNSHQILGAQIGSEPKSTMVVCWTRRGEGKGGTGQALRLAHHFKVPVIDLGTVEGYNRISKYLA